MGSIHRVTGPAQLTEQHGIAELGRVTERLDTVDTWLRPTSLRPVTSLVIAHDNDTHGHYMPNKHQEGGFAVREALIASLRAEASRTGGEFLKLFGGDWNTGTPESDFVNAEPDVRSLRRTEDAVCVGNHEFDKALAILKTQIEWFGDVPVLGANVRDRATGEPLLKSHVVVERGDLRIGIMGLLTPTTAVIANRQTTGSLIFDDPIVTARRLVRALREEEGCDVVIAVTHLGHSGDDVVPDLHGDQHLARAVRGIDVIVGGHTPERLHDPDVEGDTRIVHMSEKGREVGQLTVRFRGPEALDHHYAIYPVNQRVRDAEGRRTDAWQVPRLDPDVAAAAELASFASRAADVLDRRVGTIDGELLGRGPGRGETNLGRLVAHTQRVAVGADVAVVNDGGVRDDIDPPDMTWREIRSVQPFQNKICTVQMTGAQLASQLEAMLFAEDGTPRVVHMDGIRVTVSGGAISAMEIGGEPVDLKASASKRYSLAMNSFLAEGGDGLPDLSARSDLSFLNTERVDYTVMGEFMEARQTRGETVAVAAFAQPSVIFA